MLSEYYYIMTLSRPKKKHRSVLDFFVFGLGLEVVTA
jgi:hypothetical protein